MFMLWTIALLTSAARAELAPECVGLKKPGDYDEQVQQDFLQNFPALSASLSPIHGPIPHRPGNGAIGIDLSYIPQLGCDRRTVLGYTKTEDTNKSPVLPRPRATFAFPAFEVGQKMIIPYGGVGFVPPVPISGTRNTMMSAELGVGMYLSPSVQAGLRVHATLQRTVGNIAGAFSSEDPEYDDLYLSSTTGADVIFGYKRENITPYLALGVTEVQSFFWIGDNDASGATVANNQHPYFGPSASLGVDALVKGRLRLGGEFYTATGGYTDLDEVDNSLDVEKASRYGSIYTGRMRIAYELRKKTPED
ncbi:MAG: hypothetical protein ACI8S6_004385 [Myxococcota bacterium]|jgi:hypothetical protein